MRPESMSLRTIWEGLARMEVLVAYRAWQAALDLLEDEKAVRVDGLLAQGSQLIDAAQCAASLIFDGVIQTDGLRASPQHPVLTEATARAAALRALVDDVWTVTRRVAREVSRGDQNVEAIRAVSQRHLALLRGACLKWIRFHGRRGQVLQTSSGQAASGQTASGQVASGQVASGQVASGQALLAYACLHRLRAIMYCHEALSALLQLAGDSLNVVHHTVVQEPDSVVQVALKEEDGEAEDDAAMQLSQL